MGKKIVILAAFDLETKPLAAALNLGKATTFGFTWRWKRNELQLVQTNIGKVHAAAVTQYVIDHERPDVIINVGLCGGFKDKINPGDVVMIDSVVQYDMDQTKLGFPLGRIQMIEKIVLPLQTIHIPSSSLKIGRCVTADKLLSDQGQGRYISNLFNPSVVDMELGSIVQVCYLNQVPVLSLKCPADVVENEEVSLFESRAASCMQSLCKVVRKMIVTIQK